MSKILTFKSLKISRELFDFIQFGTEFDRRTPDVLTAFKVRESKVKVTA